MPLDKSRLTQLVAARLAVALHRAQKGKGILIDEETLALTAEILTDEFNMIPAHLEMTTGLMSRAVVNFQSDRLDTNDTEVVAFDSKTPFPSGIQAIKRMARKLKPKRLTASKSIQESDSAAPKDQKVTKE